MRDCLLRNPLSSQHNACILPDPGAGFTRFSIPLGGKNMDLIREVTQEYLKTDIPDFRPGDNVKVHVRLKEG